MTQREHEKAIFEAFLRVMPGFAGETLKDWSQPVDEKEFPDIVCMSTSAQRIGVELGQWLDPEQMRDAKGMGRIQDSILEALGDQGHNTTENILRLWLSPKPKARLKPSDATPFRKQLFRCIEETDSRWPTERFWHTPQGYAATSEELSSFPILQKYLTTIRFFSRERYEGWPPNGRLVKHTWPRGQRWIGFPARGGWFSEDTMLQSLFELLADKKERYGATGTGFKRLCLVVYYNCALIYNSPVETPQFKFEDAAKEAGQFIGDDPDPFDRIFLFVAVDDGCVLTIA